MPSIPWNSIFLLALVNFTLAIGVSVVVGCLIASAIGRPIRSGVLVGSVLPFLGPLVWAMRAGRAGSFGNRLGASIDRSLRRALAVTFVLTALAYLIAMGLPWARVEGNLRDYAAFGDASPLDSVVGAVGLGLCAAVLIGCAASLGWATRWWASALVVTGSGLWLALSVSTLILFAAVNHLAANLGGLSKGVVEAHLTAGSGTWTVFGASVIALVAGLILGVSISRSGSIVGNAASTPVPAADSPVTSTGFDYGDGF